MKQSNFISPYTVTLNEEPAFVNKENHFCGNFHNDDTI